MTPARSALLPALLALAAPQLAAADAPQTAGGHVVELAQLTIRERVIVRVPRMSAVPPPGALPRPVRWKEKRGPKCINPNALAGALVTAPDRIDLVLRGGQRVRARLRDECRGLGFYSGFYLRPGPDGAVCADRDSVRARSGAACPIDKFRRLAPQF